MIGGLQKMTLLDFPGKVACTVFVPFSSTAIYAFAARG